MLILSLALAALFACGFCKCLISTDISQPDNNVDVLPRTCEMGSCIENKCVCDIGWSGELCDSCTGRVFLNDSFGFIYDGPKNYSHRSKCSWLIQPFIPHSSLRLTFHEFSTECGWDYLFVYDGDSAFSPLIGSFNGLLSIPGQTNRIIPEIIAKSGTAFVHFYSDVAYHTIGFNISYTIDQCLYNCFDKGKCSDGRCECQDTRGGETCNICSNNCTTSSNSFVECAEDVSTCDLPNPEGSWSVVEFNTSIMPATASSSISFHNNSVWVYGGMHYSLPAQSSGFLAVFNISENSWKIHKPALRQYVTPEERYAHTMVAWQDKLIVFGGKLVRSETAVNEMWEYDMLLSQWTPIIYSADFGGSETNSEAGLSRLKLSGHTANLVKISNGSEIMIVLFGYHPTMLVTRFIYEYNPNTKFWKMPRPSGTSVPGLFGHSTAYDSSSNLLYIHGGYKSDRSGTKLQSGLYLYDPEKRQFSVLKSSATRRSFHSASFVNGLVYVYGGNTHNDTYESKGALCFSSDLMAYHVACDRWITLPSPPGNLYPHRYGHRSVVVGSNEQGPHSIYIFSGYDSTMISNILIYQPPTCTDFSMNESMCEGAVVHNISCYWNGTACLLETACSNASAVDLCSVLYLDSSCSHCVSSPHGCSYCSSKCIRSRQGCNNKTCEVESSSYCRSLINCEQCEAARADCSWDQGCFAKENVPIGVSQSCNARFDCTLATTCDACGRRPSCMWCMKPELCIPTNAYLLNFPYGQCLEWTSGRTCPSYNCSLYKTCAECHNYTTCGWCDDGSLTGVGSCMDGSGAGAVLFNKSSQQYEVDYPTCPSSNWYFTSCPQCQCNGHSRCNAENECIKCMDNTAGPHCDVCSKGYFGNPLHGGTCSACRCEGKAVTCRATGECNCFTKGEAGPTCEQCDVRRFYRGNASGNGTCFYPLSENFVFTFTLSLPGDAHITAINFLNIPALSKDVQMSFSSAIPCNLRFAAIANVPLFGFDGEVTLKKLSNTRSTEFTFSNRNLNFGDETNATIRIYVSDFTSPNTIRVSLIQRDNILLTILLILFSSFLIILFLAAGVWKVKVMYDSHRHRAHRAIQMKKMAARPFARVNLCCDDVYRSAQGLLSPYRQNKGLLEDVIPDAICEEKCEDNTVSVVSVFLWLPSSLPNSTDSSQPDSSNTCGSELLDRCYVTPPSGQTALAIGSMLSNGRRIAKRSRTPKMKRKEIENYNHSRSDELAVVDEAPTVEGCDIPRIQNVQM